MFEILVMDKYLYFETNRYYSKVFKQKFNDC